MKSFKNILSEISQPVAGDEIDFKAKHEIEFIDHPESEEHQHTSDKKKAKRIADYEEGEDEDVYESLEYVLEEEKDMLDPVNKKALKKDFDDRKDKDIDNDGDTDDSDEYLHKRRQAISKNMKKENAFIAKAAHAKKKDKKKFEIGGDKYPVTIKKDTVKKVVEDNEIDTKKQKEAEKELDAVAEANISKSAIQNAIDRAAKRKIQLTYHEAMNEAKLKGDLKLKDGSTVKVSASDEETFNNLFDELTGTNKKKMMDKMMSDKKGYAEILRFAKEAL